MRPDLPRIIDNTTGVEMSLKFAALLLLLAAAPYAVAQTTTINFTATTQVGVGQGYRYDLDHGATPSSIQFNLSADTLDVNGLYAIIIDCDEQAAGTTAGNTVGSSTTAGTLAINYTTPLRSGVHSMVVYVLGNSLAAPVSFSGSVWTKSNLLTQTHAQQFPVTSPPGTASALQWLATRSEGFNTDGGFQTTIELDLGPIPQAIPFKVLASSSAGINNIRIVDATGTPTELHTFVGNTSGIAGGVVHLTLPSYSGIVKICVESVGSGSGGSVEWSASFPTGALITNVTDGCPGVPAGASLTPTPASEDDSGGSRCTAAPGGGLWIVLALLALIAVVTVARPFRRPA